MKIKKIIPFLISLSVFLIILFIIELFFRFAYSDVNLEFEKSEIYQPDDLIGFMTKPNLTGYMKSYMEENFFIKTNNLGFRDENLGYDKKTERALVFGDSMVWGWAVDQEYIFSEVLENSLRNVEVVNLGIIPSGTGHQYIYFRNFAEEHEFNIVILVFFVGNDFSDNIWNSGYRPNYVLNDLGRLELIPADKEYVETLDLNTNYGFAQHVHILLSDNSYVYRWLYGRLRQSQFFREFISLPLINSNLPYFTFSYNTSSELYKQSVPITKEILREWKYMVESRGKEFYVFILPVREQIYDEDWNNMLRKYSLTSSDKLNRYLPQTQILNICEIINLNCIDLTPIFKEKSDQGIRLYNYYDPHLNAEGHKLLSEQIKKTVWNE